MNLASLFNDVTMFYGKHCHSQALFLLKMKKEQLHSNQQKLWYSRVKEFLLQYLDHRLPSNAEAPADIAHYKSDI